MIYVLICPSLIKVWLWGHCTTVPWFIWNIIEVNQGNQTLGKHIWKAGTLSCLLLWHILQAFLLFSRQVMSDFSAAPWTAACQFLSGFLFLLLLLSHLRITVKNMTLIKTVIDSFFNLHLASNWTQCHFHLSSSVTGQMNISQFVTEIFKGRI